MGIKDLAKPDVRTLADANQGGANQHIRLTMQPARTSLAVSLIITDRLKNGRREMGAQVCPPTRMGAETGGRPRRDHGAQRPFLRERRRRFRSGPGWPKLGPPRQRGPQMGPKVGRRARSIHLAISR